MRVAEKFEDFVKKNLNINYTAPANRKKDAPFCALGGRIVILAEMQPSALRERVCFALSK